MAMLPTDETSLRTPPSLVAKNTTRRLPGNGALFILTEHITLGKAKSVVKHSSPYKMNQQINGKEGKWKKRNDSGIAFDI